MPDTGIVERSNSKERFTKVYPQGWDTLTSLLKNRPAARLYVWLADNCGHDNALVATYETISEALELHERTIRRAVRDLEADGHIYVAKIGTANAYVLNPDEVWKTYEEHKNFCSFRTRALVSTRANAEFVRRLTHRTKSR